MLEVVASFADELIVTTNEEPELRYLLERHPKLRLVSDVMEERGALPGLLTAIEASSNDAVGVVACDMIAFSPQIYPRGSCNAGKWKRRGGAVQQRKL